MEEKQIIIRLKRAEGQLRGIQKMLENNRDYTEILNQIAAVQSATENVAIAIIENNARIYINKAIKNGGGDTEFQELIKLIKYSIKK